MNLSDKNGKVCYYCRKKLDNTNLKTSRTKDHIIAKSKFGTDDEENLCVACWNCNQWKSNMGLEKWLKVVQRWLHGKTKHDFYSKTELGQIVGNIKKKIADLSNSQIRDYKKPYK